MNRESLEALLDRVYELEGLVHLALTREEIPERLVSLIEQKGLRISETISGTPDAEAMPEAENLENEGWEAEEDIYDEEVADATLEEAREDAVIVEEKDAVTVAEATADAVPNAAVAVEEGVAEVADEPAYEDEEDMAEEDTEDTYEDVEEDTYDDVAEDEEMDEEVVEKVAAPAQQVAPHENLARQQNAEKSTPLRNRFSLNDRFRFSRELFGGNTRRFDETVRLLDTFATFDEAEDYIVVQLGWDPEADDAAAEFVDVMRNYFKR